MFQKCAELENPRRVNKITVSELQVNLLCRQFVFILSSEIIVSNY
jgi:hypothetical protein